MIIINLLSSLKQKTPEEQIGVIDNIRKNLGHISKQDLEKAMLEEKSPWLQHLIASFISEKELSSLARKQKISAKESYEEINIGKSDIDIEGIKSEAFSESIGQLLHELDPIIGSISIHAKQEVTDFNTSKLKSDLEDLEDVIITFENWRKVEQSPRYKTTKVSKLIDEEITRQIKKSTIKIDNNISTSIEVITDPAILKIAISNAIRNAVEATNLSSISSSPIIINGGLTDKNFWVSIIDNGSGLAKEFDILFQSRFTTKTGHNGLGLAIIKKAVSALDGKWELKNGAIRGAEFHLELPLRDNK
ncbi:sensor histidine kinase [Vibrio splendidus]